MLRGICRRSKKQTQLIKVWRQDVIDMSFLDFCFVLFLLWIVIFVILLFYLDGDLSLMWHAKFGRKICKYKKCVKVCWHSSILKSLQFDDFLVILKLSIVKLRITVAFWRFFSAKDFLIFPSNCGKPLQFDGFFDKVIFLDILWNTYPELVGIYHWPNFVLLCVTLTTLTFVLCRRIERPSCLDHGCVHGYRCKLCHWSCQTWGQISFECEKRSFTTGSQGKVPG